MHNNSKYKILEEIYPDALDGISKTIDRFKVNERFKSVEVGEENIKEIEDALELCELAIIERWDEREKDEFKQLCSIFLDLGILVDIPSSPLERIFFGFKLIAIGYLGESWHIVRKYLIENESKYKVDQDVEEWNERLISTIFNSLLFTVRKKNWQDLSKAIEWINRLREEQQDFEKQYVSDDDGNKLKLIDSVSLYHLAKAVELLSTYLIDGRPSDILAKLNFHIEYCEKYLNRSNNYSLSLLIQYFQPFSKKIVKNSIWYMARGMNSRVSEFKSFITKRKEKPIFELLYPQRDAILEGGLLDDANDAVVVNLPTSSGKTLIAEFRMLKALNQFSDQGGWIAYAVPTRTLVNQVYSDFQQDLGQDPLDIKVEKLSGALELDAYEEELLDRHEGDKQFDILVCTYEKLQLLIRQGYGHDMPRPLVLTVIDEAHNIGENTRGIGLELLLATIKKDCEHSNFLLLSPEIPNSSEIAEWLGEDRSSNITMGLHWWQPNERIIGALQAEGEARDFDISLKPLLTSKGTISIDDDILIQEFEDYEHVPVSQVYNNKGRFAAITACESDHDDQQIILARTVKDTFRIAKIIYNYSSDDFEVTREVELLQKYIATELGENHQLIEYLNKGIAVHSSAIPNDIRLIIEKLVSKNKIPYLVATTTIAQGLNFPVSSVIMAAYSYPRTSTMPSRDFWNLVGRVGRTKQEGVGFVGICSSDDEDLAKIAGFVKDQADDLKSTLVEMVSDALEQTNREGIEALFYTQQWSSFLQYISHLYRQTDSLENFLSSIELDLQRTLGYRQLDEDQKRFVTDGVRQYVESVSPGQAELSDKTGFSTVSVGKIISSLQRNDFSSDDWNKQKLFSQQSQSLQKLVGVMMNAPEVRSQLSEIDFGDQVFNRDTISKLITDWVSGKNISELANKYYSNVEDPIKRINDCARAVYSKLVNAAPWGLSAIQKMNDSGIDWDSLDEDEKRKLSNLPAMVYYGVDSDEAVLMRKQDVPRSIAGNLGSLFKSDVEEDILHKTPSEVMTWLKEIDASKWEEANPRNSTLHGSEYKEIWELVTGIS